MQPVKLVQYLGIAVAAMALASCKTLELPTKKIDYQSSTKLPPLEVPPDLTQPSSDDRFVVPDVTPRGTATYSAYSQERAGRPQATRTSVLPSQENARVERAGTQRWLVVQGEPGMIWPTVKDFWQEAGFIVNLEIPEAGVMETDWAENRAKVPQSGIRGFLGRALDNFYSSAERDKFRTRLERGKEAGTTEIYISHRGMEEVFTGQGDAKDTRWQPRPPNPELEAEMLGRLMARFGVQEDRVKAQLADRGGEPRATLVRGQDGLRALSLNEQFDRAWRRVGLALDRVGFTVEDRDRSKGLYFVRYIDPEVDNKSAEDKGWFAKFKFWGSDKKQSAERYRVQVKDVAAGAEVNVLNKEGAQEQSDTATRILSLLYEQLK
ncbi:MAG: outer membrane protein assembly factor BamC [Betaproteobacteria bacterium]|nr:outer membrane protein assembly factor BamC [Betaproteobacteria bacterium]